MLKNFNYMNYKFKSIKLHPGQSRILSAILKSDKMYNVIKTSRQFGKTTLAQQILLYYMINKKCKIGWFSPYIPQAKIVMKQIYNAIFKSDIVKSYNQTDREIELINGSVIKFYGVDNPDIIRGNSFDYIICDEAAFYNRDVFEEVIRPTLLVRGKKCYLISTPKGKANWFYKYYINEDNFSIEGNYLENPFVNKLEIEAARKILPQHLFRQEYGGEFLDSEFQVFQNLENCLVLNKYAEPTEYNFGGLDLGRKSDYTVLTIFNKFKQLVYMYRVNHTTWETQINEIIKILKRYNTFCFVDATGVGDPVFEQLHKQYKHLEPIIITGSGEHSKQNIVETLIITIQNNEIQLPTKILEPLIYEEFSSFQAIYSHASKTIRYEAIQGFHDDIVLSIVLANLCIKNDKKVNTGIKLRVIR